MESSETSATPALITSGRIEHAEVRPGSGRLAPPFFVSRYRHDKPDFGLIEPVPMADQLMVSVEFKPLDPTDMFRNGRHVRKPAANPASLALYDLRESWGADLRIPFDNLNFLLPLSSFQKFSEERGQRFVEVPYNVEQITYDPIMAHLALAALPALERPREVDGLYLDHMFLAVRDHVASKYGIFRAKAVPDRRGLTGRQIARACDYIEAKLGEDIGLAEIANACAVSVSSLTRGFKDAMGVSPYQWVIRRRIAAAQRLMRDREAPLADIAAACGFADQSHFARVLSDTPELHLGLGAATS